jgi:Predicted membrane protein
MEGSRRTWLDPDKEDSFLKKYFSFSGRLGRGAFGARMLFLLFLFWVALILLSYNFPRIPGLFVILILPLWARIAMLVCVLCGILSNLSMATRRLHDMGKSGGLLFLWIIFMVLFFWIGFSTQSGFSLLLAMIGLAFFNFYLVLWPGEHSSNDYGEPQRFRAATGETPWQQLKRELFDANGRVGRKWFFWLAVFCLPNYYINIFGPGIEWWVVYLRDFTNLLFSSVTLVIAAILARRRLQDIGWSFYWALIPISMGAFSRFGGFFAAEQITMLRSHVAWIVAFLILSVIPGQEGSNEHGRNPVEADLLPGEVAD